MLGGTMLSGHFNCCSEIAHFFKNKEKSLLPFVINNSNKYGWVRCGVWSARNRTTERAFFSKSASFVLTAVPGTPIFMYRKAKLSECVLSTWSNQPWRAECRVQRADRRSEWYLLSEFCYLGTVCWCGTHDDALSKKRTTKLQRFNRDPE